MNTEPNTPLSEIEWTTCWMAIRYAMGRCSAASASLPRELLAAYAYRWTNGQKKMIVRDLRSHLDDIKRWNNADDIYFGDPNIDHPIWMKFLLTLDESAHVEVTMPDGQVRECFEYDGWYYALNWWEARSLPIAPELLMTKVEHYDK